MTVTRVTAAKHINDTLSGINAKKQALNEALDNVVGGHAKAGREQRRLENQIQKCEQSLKNFVAIGRGCNLHFTLVMGQRSDPDQAQAMRTEFRDDFSVPVMKNIAACAPQKLLEMRLSQEQIDHILEHGTVPQMKPEQGLGKVDLTRDHVLELGLGGDNSHENIVLDPYHINWLRNRWVEIQIEAVRDRQETLSLAFKNGQRPVPIFRNGFRPKDERPNSVAKRILEDLGIDLDLGQG